MSYAIVVLPAAKAQLDALYDYIALHASPTTASQFVGSILDQIDKLTEFPDRGSPRDEIMTGLRTIGFRRRVTIAFVIQDMKVFVVGVFYGGQDFETLVRGD